MQSALRRGATGGAPGAAVAPEPYEEPSRNHPPPPRPHARAGALAAGRASRPILRGARPRLSANRPPAGQARLGRGGGSERRVDAAGTRGFHQREHRRRAHPVRRAGRPALAGRAACSAGCASGAAAMVRRMRPGDADVGLRRRRAALMPALQVGRHSQPRQSCPAAGPRPSPFICATAVLRSPTVSVTNLACRQDSHLPSMRCLSRVNSLRLTGAELSVLACLQPASFLRWARQRQLAVDSADRALPARCG